MRGLDTNMFTAEDYIPNFVEESGFLHYVPRYHDVQLRFSSWREGLEIRRWCGGGWVVEQAVSHYVLLAADKGNMRSEAESLFLAQIPQEVQDAAAFFQYGQLQVLRTLRQWPDSLEMAVQAPLLFLLLVEKIFVTDPALTAEQVVELLTMKRKELLDWLGFAGSKSMCSFLAKIELDCCTEDDFLAVKKLLGNTLLREKFSHFPKIGRIHLVAVAQYRSLLLYPFFLHELRIKQLTPAYLENIYDMYNDTNVLGVELGKAIPGSTVLSRSVEPGCNRQNCEGLSSSLMLETWLRKMDA